MTHKFWVISDFAKSEVAYSDIIPEPFRLSHNPLSQITMLWPASPPKHTGVLLDSWVWVILLSESSGIFPVPSLAPTLEDNNVICKTLKIHWSHPWTFWSSNRFRSSFILSRYLDQETVKWPLRSSIQAATCFYQSNHS